MLHGSPWVYAYSHWHQVTTQQRPKGPGGCSRSPKKRDFSANPLRPEKGYPLHWGPTVGLILETWR